MAQPTMSLQRWLDHHFLQSLDEEDLMALTEAIVEEATIRRLAGQQLQRDAQGTCTWVETPPTLHEDASDTLEQAGEGERDENQRLPVRLAEPQEE